MTACHGGPKEKQLLTKEDRAAALFAFALLLSGSAITGLGADLGLAVIGLPGLTMVLVGLIFVVALAHKWGTTR